VSPTAQLRPVLTTQGDRYAVAAIVVQEVADGAGTAELTELASRLADEARRLLLADRPDSTVTAAVAISDSPSPAVLPVVPAGLDIDRHAHRVSVDDRPVELSYREFVLLAFLAEHPGRRARPPAADEARPVRGRHRHRPQRRLPVRAGPRQPRTRRLTANTGSAGRGRLLGWAAC
jgi:hypothetical protein